VIAAEENIDGLAGKRGPSREGGVDDAGVRARRQQGDARAVHVRGEEAFVEDQGSSRTDPSCETITWPWSPVS
jgi:hypothetical protein